MKKISVIFMLVLAMVVAMPAQAKIRMGVKLGANVNVSDFGMDAKNFSFENTSLANFTGGVTLEWIIFAGFGIDAGAMYTARGTEYAIGADFDHVIAGLMGGTMKNNIHYIEVPVNLRYKLEIPAIEKIIAPFIYAGPSFAFKVGESVDFSKDLYKEIVDIVNNDVAYAINVGLGVEIVEKLQVAVQYGWGVGAASELKTALSEESLAKAKSGTWTITAAWYF